MIDWLAAAHDAIDNFCRQRHRFAYDHEDPKVRLHEPTFGADEIKAALDCLLSTNVTQGAKVKAFEKAFVSEISPWEGVSSNSGSSANLLAIAGLVSQGRLKPGDEVIVSALSWSTTVWPLVQHGLVPVLVDCERDTLNIDPKEVVKAIGPKTRAIMPVHVYGNPCDMDALTDIRSEYGLLLIEDCCEALGASWKGAPVGTFGDVGTFSFYFSHHITTLEGGITITLDRNLADVMRIQRAHGWIREVEDKERWTKEHPEIDPKFLFVDTGYNLRLTEPQAAIGLLQIPKLKAIVETRRKNHRAYHAKFLQLPYLRIQRHEDGSSCFGFNFVLDGSVSRSDLARHLQANGIESRPIIAGNLAVQPGMKRYPHRVVGDLANANDVLKNGLSIGCHHFVSYAAVDYVAEVMKAFRA